MLAADKLQLQSSLKQQATALKEKEFNLHHSNLMTVGTQAAVLAGLDMTMFVEFNPPPNSEWNPEIIGRSLKFLYYIMITSAFCANILVVAQTTIISVLGAGMALRGPDGSMMTATDGLYEERKSVFWVFGLGLACTLASVVLCVWVILHWEAALACMTITLITIRKVYQNYERVRKRFDFDENDTVDFRDIFDGAANIHTFRIPVEDYALSHNNNNNNNNHHNYKKGTPNSRRSNRPRKHSGSNQHQQQRHHQSNNDPRWESGTPNTSDEELAMMRPPNTYNQRTSSEGMQQRRGYADSSAESFDGGHQDDFIQTV